MARETALYEIPATLEIARVLGDSMLNEYNASVKSSYNSDKARAILSKFGKSNGELTNSNNFMLAHLQNSGLLQGRIATKADLESALRFGLNLSGNYVDFGLALRTAGDSYSPNDMLAKNLAEQLRKRDIKLEKGKLIQIGALSKPIEDNNSEYGLVFSLNELSKKELFDSGLIKDLSQFKWNYERDEGLAGAYFNEDGSWGSLDFDLGSGFGASRVVVVSAEDAAKNSS